MNTVQKDEFITDAFRNRKLGKAWKIEGTEKHGSISITNPANVTHQLFTTFTEWMDAFNENEMKSARLWIFSLDYITDVYKISPHAASLALKSFYEAFDTLQPKLSASLTGSWDHCVAVRLKALVTMVGCGDPVLASQASNYLDIELSSENVWDLIRKNNHGLMLVESLIYVGIVRATRDPAAGLTDIKNCTDQMEGILDRVFGEDFYCGENTPFYHNFYIEKLVAMEKRFSGIPELAHLRNLMRHFAKEAMTTLEKIVFPDGTVPGMGDSNAGMERHRSINGTHWSTRTGFWVWKSDKLYLSLKCGHDTVIHKHADDTSIAVRYLNEDFIADAGNASFNYADPRILMLRTQRGHSGVFFEKFDSLHPAHLYKGKYLTKGSILTPTKSSVRGSYTVEGSHFAHRSLAVVDEENFVVEDWAAAVDGSSAIHRFIIPPSIKIAETSDGLVLEGDKAYLHMRFPEDTTMSITKGQEEKPFKGWISVKAFQVTAASCLEVRSRPNVNWPVKFSFEFVEK